jgi:hypothetical protein
MYQKITDGFTTLERQKELEEKKARKKSSMQPMSYVVCPECDNPQLEKCECEGGKNNYYCAKCQFRYIHHHHKSAISTDSKNVGTMDKSIIAKVIR